MAKITSLINKTAKKKHLDILNSDLDAKAIPYDKMRDYCLGDYICHKDFGFGFVQKIISQTKIEVFFENSVKVMMQNWQEK